MTGDGVTYWRVRAEALDAEVEALRRRLLLLANVVPYPAVRYLHEELSELERETPPADLLADWEETYAMTPSDVATEMQRVWERLAPVAPGPP